MPHGSAAYQQHWVPPPALRHRRTYGRHPAPLLPRSRSPDMRRGQHTRALMLSLWLIRRDRYIDVCDIPSTLFPRKRPSGVYASTESLKKPEEMESIDWKKQALK